MASESEDLVLTDLDLASWARAAARRLEAQAEEKGVLVEVAADAPVRITADATSVDRILENLLSNAIRFNVRGGSVRVELALETFEARITVSDTGIGIPEGEQEKIFQRFYQVDTESGRSMGGTGIGLAIVKEAVERHGGRVRVESTPGKGASFHVFLPSGAHMKDDTGVFLAPPRWEGFVLVLADPNDSERAGERATLLAEGFAVLSALDLKEARDHVERHRPHAALFDAALLGDRPPGETGPLLAVPSVAMLPERDPAAVKAALEAGAVGTLLKPFQKKEFLFLLEKALEI